MFNLLVRVFLINIVILTMMVDPSVSVIQRIQRFHSREMSLNVGDTVKLTWKYDVDEGTRKEELLMFFCGYRLKDFSKQSHTDPPIIPLAISVDTNDFFSVTDDSKSSQLDLKSVLRPDDLGLGKHLSVYMDRYNHHCIMELQKISDQIEKVEEFACQLQYKAPATEKLIGGVTKIKLNSKKSNTPSPCTASTKTKPIVRGEIFLGAILFDVLLSAVVLSASLIWNRKSKGYSRVNTGIKKKKKKKIKKDKNKDDVEKGKNKMKEKSSKVSGREGRSSEQKNKTSSQGGAKSFKSSSRGDEQRRTNQSDDRKRSRSPRPPRRE